MVRCKMQVTRVIQSAWAGDHTSDEVELSAVSDDANKTWAKYTPSGSVKLSINNPEALKQFKPGEFYFVDFSPAPKKEADEAK